MRFGLIFLLLIFPTASIATGVTERNHGVRISDQQALNVVAKLLDEQCGRPSTCSMAAIPGNDCPIVVHVVFSERYSPNEKIPVLRIGLDKNGAFLGAGAIGERICTNA